MPTARTTYLAGSTGLHDVDAGRIRKPFAGDTGDAVDAPADPHGLAEA